jgi:hypothetical protein
MPGEKLKQLPETVLPEFMVTLPKYREGITGPKFKSKTKNYVKEL